MPVHEIRSISQVGTSEPFELQISRGQIPGHYRLFKFGFNPLIQETEETIWESGGIYSYPSTALSMTATSAAGATDNGVELVLQGLDADYNELSETITLAGSGTATTINSFLRLNRAFVSGDTEPTGLISITNGGVTYASINGDNQTLMCLWTVPAGYSGYITQTDVTVLTEANNKFGNVRLVTREPNGVFRTKDLFSAQNADIVRQYSLPIKIPEKTDIEYRAVGSSSNSDLRISAAFEILYIKNDSRL